MASGGAVSVCVWTYERSSHRYRRHAPTLVARAEAGHPGRSGRSRHDRLGGGASTRPAFQPAVPLAARRAGRAAGSDALSPAPTFVQLALPPPVFAAAERLAGSGVVEIELAGGHRLWAEAGAELSLLQGVIAVLLHR